MVLCLSLHVLCIRYALKNGLVSKNIDKRTTYNALQELPGFLLLPNVRGEIMYNRTIPHIELTDKVIIIDKLNPMFEMCTFIIMIVFGSNEIICIVLVFSILRVLKKNSRVYTQTTYRLHRQFTLLLAAQVS